MDRSEALIWAISAIFMELDRVKKRRDRTHLEKHRQAYENEIQKYREVIELFEAELEEMGQ